VNVQVRDLNGDLLGFAPDDSNTILIDRDAAGRGWFVDQTPWDDYEFDTQGFSIADDADGVDLLSVLTHEMGHVLGLDHGDGVMSETLGVGERRLPSNASAYDFALARMLEDTDDDFWR